MVNVETLTEEQVKDLAFSEEELKQIKKARQMKFTFDAECPPTTPETAGTFYRVNPPRGRSDCNS